MDKMVQEVQQWLNDTWPTQFKYDETGTESGSFPIEPDGMTGNKTVTALVMALQLKLGLTADGAWGNKTTSSCPTITPSTQDSTLLRIVQGGFICKGYDPGGFDGIIGSRLIGCINTFKSNLGLAQDSQLKPKEFKSLLTTDPSVLVLGGKSSIRNIQKFLNNQYSSLFVDKLGYLPTGGEFERKTAKAIIYAFQSEINTTADGSIGNKTYAAMPSISSGNSNKDLIKILQCALTCNGYDVGLNGVYDDEVQDAVSHFQQFVRLDLDPAVTLGSVNRRTWAALLHSKGDPERKANACDCATILDSEKAVLLSENGFDIIGRYLTGTVRNSSGERVSKALTREEIKAISEAGLKIFAIYQDGGASETYFGYEQGYADARKAINAASHLNIPRNEIIYFAVDYDFNVTQCREKIIPHFSGITAYMKESGNHYRVGIYASRYICSIMEQYDLACSSFVADMSTGYSGNLGFTMPENWAFDQFHEFKFTSGNQSFDLDKDMASGRYAGFNLESKCNQENYFDCSKHPMILRMDGYYECVVCGYKVPSPLLQDREVLSADDYLKITALLYAYTFSLADVDTYGIYFYDWWKKMYEIRSKEEYKGKYAYCDEDRVCLFIPPDIDLTGVERPNAYITEPILITSSNIDQYDGVLSIIIDELVDVIFDIAFPAGMAGEVLLAIQNLQQGGSAISSMNMLMQALASLRVETKAFAYILQLIELGCDITDEQEKREIAVGDTLIEIVDYETLAYIPTFYILFDKDLKVKNFYFKS